MRRRRIGALSLLLAFVAMLLVACGSNDDDSASTTTSASSGETTAETTTTETPRLEGDLNVAVFGGPTEASWRTSFGEPFAEATGVNVRIGGVPAPSALATAQKGKPQFDLLLVTGTDAARFARDPEIYDPVDPSELSRSGELLDGIAVEQDGKWVATPGFMTYYAIVVNKDEIDPSSIRSWADLQNPEFKDRLLLNNPVFGATDDLPMLALANGGSMSDVDPGFELLRRIVPNVRTTITSLADAASQMANGEATISPFYFSQYGQLLDQNIPVEMVVPEEGALGSPLYLMIPKGAKNRENAIAFLDFVLQPEQQEAAQDASSYLPVVKDAELIPKVQERVGRSSMSELVETLNIPDYPYFAANAGDWVRRIESILAGN
jgi:putative spermidine/putrescine transport system substrate-binding protein